MEKGLSNLGPTGIKYRNCRRREDGCEAKEKCGFHAWLVALHYINSTCGIKRRLSISHRRLCRVPIDLFVNVEFLYIIFSNYFGFLYSLQ